MKKEFPKIIWIAWFQGLEDAPEIVKICYNSWIQNNPGWKVILLDKYNVCDFFDTELVTGKNRSDVTIQKKSNILRLNLLAQRGGVWADATCFCSTPLDNWIYEYTKSGFFAFRHSEKDRLISNWFMASEKDCYLTQTFCKQYNLYWAENIFSNNHSKIGQYLIKKLPRIPQKIGCSTDFLVSDFMAKVLKIHPYFGFHYYFAYHVKRDSASRYIFEQTPPASCDDALQFARMSRKEKDIGLIREAVATTNAPVHKLTWKENIFKRGNLSILEYISLVFS